MRARTYLLAYSTPMVVWLSFALRGPWSFLPIVEVFALLPLVELWLRPRQENASARASGGTKASARYDRLLYATVPVHFATLLWFLWLLAQVPLNTAETVGLTLGMGVCNGVLGINVAHEIGHRKGVLPQLCARLLLMSTLYGHFVIEHNRGHHKHVGTPGDPASARRGESVYRFWIRSIVGTYLSAWRIEARRLQPQKGLLALAQNEMLWITLAELMVVVGLGLTLGWPVALAFAGAAAVGILLLETVNYIEHYGLTRRLLPSGAYERTRPQHSWNANQPLGRILLFELTRHADHHYLASRPYHMLRHLDDAPQLPTGYPGMMLLSFVPPLFFRVMHPRIDALQANT